MTPIGDTAGQGWQPTYSLLFHDSQDHTYLSYSESDEISKIQIYALEAKMIKAGGMVSIKIRSNYSLKSGPVVFVPSYDKKDKQLLHLITSDPCGKRATISIFNNSSLSRRIHQQQIIGTMEELDTEDIYTPSFKCTGDRKIHGSELPWSNDSDECHIFSTLVSVNQQENVYESSNNVYLPGPSPNNNEKDEICPHRTQNCSGPGNRIKTVIADLADKVLFGKNDILCQQVNCSLRQSHGLSKFLEVTYPYGSVYLTKAQNKRNVLPDNLLREPGRCILNIPGDERSPMIANITGQFYFGKPIEQCGYQEKYLKKFGTFCGKNLIINMKNDTAAQRLIWFQKGLQEMYTQIKDIEGNLNIYFNEHIGCESAGGMPTNYEKAIQNFADKLQNQNIHIYMVKDPTNCSSTDFEKYELLNQAPRTMTIKHKPGLYKDAPVSFCKDPNCKGCLNNKMVLKLLAEELDVENDHPVESIQNGMEPEIPKAATDNERSQIFAEMLGKMDTSNLTEEQACKVKDILLKYAKLFLVTDYDEAGLIPDFEASIDTMGEPIACKPRRFGEKALHIMEELNITMQKKGLTVPCDGPWASPVVLVKKKSLPGIKQDPNSPSSYRFCIDYRRINQHSIQNKAYPNHNLKQMLHKAAGHNYNTTIDVINSLYCISVRQ